MTTMQPSPTPQHDAAYDAAWEDPLPHAFAPRKHYLRRVRAGTAATEAVVIFMHGRGDSIDDMVGVFLPLLARRYGGTPSVLPGYAPDDSDEREESGTEPANVAVIGLEARDNIWYPQSHHATGQEAQDNAPFQYSALERLRQTLVDVVLKQGVSPQRVAVVGFSQGAMLATSYVMSILQPQAHDHASSHPIPLTPLPAHTLALAGSVFAESPPFPWRKFSNAGEEAAFVDYIKDEVDGVTLGQGSEGLERLLPSAAASEGDESGKSASVRLLCGTKDRFFTSKEIEEAAATLARACTAAANSNDDNRMSSSFPSSLAHAAAKRLKISVGFEPNAPHQITNHMMAATISAIDSMLRRSK